MPRKEGVVVRGGGVLSSFFLSPSPRDLILLIIQVLCNQDLGINPPMNER